MQERVTDPLATVELVETPEGGANNPELEQLLNETNPGGTPGGDGSANPLNFESGQLNNPGPVIGTGGEPLPVPLSGLEREYVWGPGDNGLDEILVQYDLERKAFWMIQDGGGDVVAMCDLAGSGGGGGGTARVVKSWSYDAYGQCLRATDVVAATGNYSIPMNRIGHKGLFMDRLDVSAANPGTYADNVRLAPFSTVLYQNRNRTYSPQLGRFIQRDPNETGQLLAAMQGCMGETAAGTGDSFGIATLYGNGGSLHAYLGATPWQNRDAMGTSFWSAVGNLAVIASSGWIVGTHANLLYNISHGRDPLANTTEAGLIGSGAALVGAASSAGAVALGAIGAGFSTYDFDQVVNDPNSTRGQKFASGVLAVMGVYGAYQSAFAWNSQALNSGSATRDAGDSLLATAAKVETIGPRMISPTELTPIQGVKVRGTRYRDLETDILANGVSETIKYVVRSDGKKVIVDGHHRHRIAVQNGITLVPVEKVELPYKGFKDTTDLWEWVR